MKNTFLLTLPLILFASGFGCSENFMLRSELKRPFVQKSTKVDFWEVRRVNRNILLKESAIITTFAETSELYSKLEDKRFSRSEPIPTLSDDEFFIVLKPELKKIQYGDFEIIRIEEENSAIKIYYKEIINNEYLLNKQSNPILILRLKGKVPESIKLISL